MGESKKERKKEWFMSYGHRHVWKGERGDEQAEVGSLIATQNHGDVWGWATARDDV